VSPDTRASYARRVAARVDPTRHSRAPEDLGRAGRGIRHRGCLRVSLAQEWRQTGSASRDARNGRASSVWSRGRHTLASPGEAVAGHRVHEAPGRRPGQEPRSWRPTFRPAREGYIFDRRKGVDLQPAVTTAPQRQDRTTPTDGARRRSSGRDRTNLASSDRPTSMPDGEPEGAGARTSAVRQPHGIAAGILGLSCRG
jgi:hypothetical protein